MEYNRGKRALRPATREFTLDDTVRASQDWCFGNWPAKPCCCIWGPGIYFGLNEVGTRIWSPFDFRSRP